MRRSLRARLTSAATLIILLGMTGAAVVLVLRVHMVLVANLDAAVTQQVQTIAVDAGHGPLPEPLPAAQEVGSVVQVIGSGGRAVTGSDNVENEDRLFSFSARSDEVRLETVQDVPVGDDHDATYRVAGLSAQTADGPVTIYAGLPTTQALESTAELVGALAVGVPVVVAALGLVGWILLGRALQPVEAMRRQAAQISGTDLHRRLDPPPAGDELSRLATTFNELLGRIETSTARQRQFVADAAHELRSPLASLRAQLEVAVRHPEPSRSGLVATDLLADTVRLSRLVDDLLALARLDASPRPARQAVDLDDLVLEEARRSRARTSRRIDTSGVSGGRVLGDPQALGRVVQNLVDNAVRHAASTVTLNLAADPTTVTLVVADDGPGIRPADRDRVFERFTRLDDARGPEAGGAGLGLAIVRDVVTAHDGHVRIDDNRPGARVTVELPAARA